MSSKQRPDTLMQDRISQVEENSCNARVTRVGWTGPTTLRHVRCTSNSSRIARLHCRAGPIDESCGERHLHLARRIPAAGRGAAADV